MTITPRELEVMQHVANGLTHERIGNAMGITRRTVEHYIASVRGKLGVQSCISAIALLISRGEIVAPNKCIDNGINS